MTDEDLSNIVNDLLKDIVKLPVYTFEKFYLPEEYKCPVCSHRLWIKPYYSKKSKEQAVYWLICGQPMISCGNWQGCHSPWNPTAHFTWHCWVRTLVDFDYPPTEPIEEENAKRKHHTIKLLNAIRREHPEVYRRIIGLYNGWILYARERSKRVMDCIPSRVEK